MFSFTFALFLLPFQIYIDLLAKLADIKWATLKQKASS